MKNLLKNTRYNGVIFDMDGTVLNTLADLTDSLNYAMRKTGHRHDFRQDAVRLFFGSGAHTAVTRALAMESGTEGDALLRIEAGSEEAFPILNVFRPHYEQHCNDNTAPYPGVTALLESLRKHGVLTAVVSNKPDPAVQKLAANLFSGCFDFIIGEQKGIRRKPAPDMLLQTVRMLSASSRECAGPAARFLFVGDSEIDLQTASAAGMDCAAVTWGFRSRTFLEKLSPDYLADTCEELAVIMGI